VGAMQVSLWFPMLYCEQPRSKLEGLNQVELTPDITAIADDGLAYGVACLQFLDSSLDSTLESLTFCKRNFLLATH
jgi:hypothetical protein